MAQAPKGGNVIEIQENAPDRYVVQKGDTLWGIAQKFLKEPWRWPQIWRLNKDQIRNPHWIYPGNVVRLDRGSMTLSIERLEPTVRVERLAGEAIPTISAKVIDPFLSQPLVIEENGLDKAPEVVATPEGRVNLGQGSRAYVAGIGDSTALLWHVYRRGIPLLDPDTQKTLGFEAVYLGQARLEKRGDPATIEIISTKREIGVGDRLVAAGAVRIFNSAPHAPDKLITGRIMTLYDGRADAYRIQQNRTPLGSTDELYTKIDETGPLGIVTVNRGAKDGLEIGNILALWESRQYTRDVSVGPWYMGEVKPPTVTIPEERYGLVMVFRVFENVSYALVVQASRPVSPGDILRTP